MIDVHSHILPSIDDGAYDITETIEMIKEAYNSGFTEIIATSHFIEESYNTPKTKRIELIDDIQKKLEEEHIGVKIYMGAEIYITPNLIELLEEHKAPTINNTKYVLIELPMHNEIIYLDEIICNLKSNNFVPIIAHPERYSYVQKNPKILSNLIQNGVLFQANYGSIIGFYGKTAQKTVIKLLKNDMIRFLGTDAHSSNSIYTQMEEILKRTEKLIGKKKLELLTHENPKKILNNKEIQF